MISPTAVFWLTLIVTLCQCHEDRNIMEQFKTHQITPDVLSLPPEKLLQVKYKSGCEVKLGNELTPKQVLEAPKVEYEADDKDYYTLILTDPDAPNRKTHQMREWNHWLVVNIPGNKVSDGDVITDYVGSAPPKGSGLHRYVFVLYKQSEKLKFDEARHGPTDGNRGKFSTEKFAKKYHLGRAVGGNFFQAQWDESVPESHRKLGF